MPGPYFVDKQRIVFIKIQLSKFEHFTTYPHLKNCSQKKIFFNSLTSTFILMLVKFELLCGRSALNLKQQIRNGFYRLGF